MTAVDPSALVDLELRDEGASRRIRVSFSGGRTSAYMAKRLLDERQPGDEFMFLFANTGQEHEATLEFVDRCDREWGLGVIWLEAKVDPRHGEGTRYRVTDFASASRTGEPFEAVIAKYGIPNQTWQPCNRELKLRPMEAYARDAGWEPGSYDTAIGIRHDEWDRVNPRYKAERLIYPLLDWRIEKPHVIRWWRTQPFDLNLPEHLGNCTWCWKKTLRKHLTLAVEHPEVFDFPARMEIEHPFSGAGDGPRRFFRKHWTTLDIKARAKLPFVPFREGVVHNDPELDRAQGCSESCDVYGAEPVAVDLFGEAA